MEHIQEVLMEAMVNGKAEVWRRRIGDQRASGQTVRTWCKANDAREHSFYWWRARLGLSAGKGRPVRQARVRPAANGFAQVLVNASSADFRRAQTEAGAPMRLRLAGERELILPASMPLEQVARLVRALEATA